MENTSINSIFQHYVRNHTSEKFSIRRVILKEDTGDFMLQSVHFPLKVCDIVKRAKDGQECRFNIDSARLTFIEAPEHARDDEDRSDRTAVPDLCEAPPGTMAEESLDVQDICMRAMEAVKQTGRGQDFVSVLTALANGTLEPENIVVHCLLDIGNFLSAESLRNVRYNTTTLDFWSLVYKMFRGKATRFFRGTMSASNDKTEGKTELNYYYGYLSWLMDCSV